jgi:hypothetical protein
MEEPMSSVNNEKVNIILKHAGKVMAFPAYCDVFVMLKFYWTSDLYER